MGRAKLTLYSLVLQPPFAQRLSPGHTAGTLAAHTRNVFLLSAPSDHAARGVLAQDTLARTPLWSTMMKPYPSPNGHRDPKQANGNDSGQLALSPQVLICPPPLLGHHPMVTSLLDWSKVIIWPMKDGDGKRTFELGKIVTMSCQQWDSNAKNLPEPKSHLFLARVHPPNHLRTFQLMSHNLRWLLRNPWRNLLVSLHSYQLFLTFSLTIYSSSHHSRLDHYHRRYAHWIPQEPQHLLPPVQSPSHPNNDARQEFTSLQPALMIP
ncbi:hypothetical protein O181_055703 [Austropuccinia psidii MF-1]|uniref:Uncharacterized protein n=1 Tax=Austropuccinia psidii MF-1 TaxID=1389203 RepID=A0A9Q3E8B1_9BASI|nr:hypothetical protein [Austropuccinia psidii MF-1]